MSAPRESKVEIKLGNQAICSTALAVPKRVTIFVSNAAFTVENSNCNCSVSISAARKLRHRAELGFALVG